MVLFGARLTVGALLTCLQRPAGSRDCCSRAQSLPGIESACKIGEVAKAGAPQNAGCDGTAIAAFAMDDEQFVAIQFPSSISQLTKGNPHGVLHCASYDFTALAHIEYRNVVFFLFQ